MRKFTLLIIITAMFICIGNAQIVNSSFENWQTDTMHFAGYAPYVPADSTTTYQDPVGWTSTNAVTNAPSLAGRSFVTQSNNAVFGNSSVSLRTDSLNPIVGKSLILPGFILNGQYQLNIASLVFGTNITPLSIIGAGQAFNQRLADFKGYYNYAPVHNPNTGGNDTCLIWATLRKGEELIANAIFKSTDSTNGFQWFQVPFNYVSCDMPDTLVILLSSSIPNIPNLLSGQSNLVRGSVLLVDTLSYDTLNPGYAFPPFAYADFDSTNKNTPVNIYVKINDADCSESLDSLNIEVIMPPSNGTATVGVGDTFITYTPNNNYTGYDTFTYILSSNGIDTSNPAQVVVYVKNGTGIAGIPQIPLLIFPVPASDELNVRFDNKGSATAKIYDMLGNLAGIFQLNGNDNVLPLTGLANGAYNLQIVNNNNQVLANARFVVNR